MILIDKDPTVVSDKIGWNICYSVQNMFIGTLQVSNGSMGRALQRLGDLDNMQDSRKDVVKKSQQTRRKLKILLR